MTQIVPWMGYLSEHVGYSVLLQAALGVTIDKTLQSGKEIVDRAMGDKFPLIIFNDVIAAGELELPEGMSKRYEDISCHLIQLIRDQGPNQDTPIVAAIMPSGKYVTPQKYLDAGANEVYNQLSDKSSTGLVHVVARILQVDVNDSILRI